MMRIALKFAYDASTIDIAAVAAAVAVCINRFIAKWSSSIAFNAWCLCMREKKTKYRNTCILQSFWGRYHFDSHLCITRFPVDAI